MKIIKSQWQCQFSNLFYKSEFNFWTNFGKSRPQCSGNGSVRWSWGLQRTLSHMNESFTKYPTVVSGTIIKIWLDKYLYWFEDKDERTDEDFYWLLDKGNVTEIQFFTSMAVFGGCGGFSKPCPIWTKVLCDVPQQIVAKTIVKIFPDKDFYWFEDKDLSFKAF